MSGSIPDWGPTDHDHYYVLDTELDNSAPWCMERCFCIDCGWNIVVVWREDRERICPMCNPARKSRVTIRDVHPTFDA